MLESHRAGVDPDTEDPFLPAHGGIFARSSSTTTMSYWPIARSSWSVLGKRAEASSIRAGEVGGDGDLAGRGADFHRLACCCGGRRLIQQHLRLSAQWRKQEPPQRGSG